MHTCHPDLDQTRTDRAALLRLFLSEVGSKLDDSLPLIEAFRATPGSPDLLDPAFVSWCYASPDCTASPSSRQHWLARLGEVLDSINQRHACALSNERSIGIRIALGTTLSDPSLAAAERTLTEIHGVACPVTPLEGLAPPQLQTLRAAFRLLKVTWPEMFLEIQLNIARLSFFDAQRVIGFVDFRTHGSIHLRADTLHDSTQLAEEVIHEASHVQLNTLLALYPLFRNGDEEIYHSPLRREPRSMFSLFHQLFVLARLSTFYARLNDSSLHIQSRIERIRASLSTALAVVREHADLTARGTGLVGSIGELL